MKRMMLLLTTVLSGALLGQAAPELTVQPELQPDPAVMKILDGLGENQSAWLPAKKVVGALNPFLKKMGMDKTGPRVRNWCLKWVWAADRKRALFCGGNAGVPHKLNDVWEYDLAANTWVLLWEPDPDTNRIRHMKDPEAKAYMDAFVKVDEETGEIMTKRGAPFDPIHTWWELTYDPVMHAMLWAMGNHHLHDKYVKLNPDQRKFYRMGSRNMRLWAYYPYEHRWQFFKPPKGLQMSANMMDYIPELGGSYYLNAARYQAGVFKSETREWTWERVASSRQDYGRKGLPPRWGVGAYDSARKIYVYQRGGGDPKDPPVSKSTYHYNVASNVWTKAVSTNAAPPGLTNVSPMTYDSVAGKCYISISVSAGQARRKKSTTKLNGLWAYDSGEKKWTCLKPDGPVSPSGMACYNPEYNVLMIDPGGSKVWVYRGRKSGGKK